jgi:hypothetical protein
MLTLINGTRRKRKDWEKSFFLAARNKIGDISGQPETFGIKDRKGYREAKVEAFPYLIVYKFYKRNKIIFISSVHHVKKHPKNKYRK